MITLIGFCGPIGAGKTTAARQLTRLGFERVRFAEPLKRMLRVLGLTESQIDGAERERECELLCGATPQWAMQSLGTEWGRQCMGADLWVNAWARIVDARLAEGASVVVDDVRFPNEADAIWRRGGKLIRIVRPAAFAGNHASERLSAESCDAKIENDGDEIALSRAVAHVLAAI